MSIFDKLFRKKNVAKFKEVEDTSSPLKQELQRQRTNTEKSLTILARCQTRHEIIQGFGQIARLLREANDPLSDAAENIHARGGDLPDEHVFRLKDKFIRQGEAFLAATDKGLREL